MAKPKVFISYAHRDSETVGKLSRALKTLNVSAWTDQQIRAGDSWESEIDAALTEAKVIILCISPSFLASDWAQLQIGVALSRARQSDVRVIPLILNDTELPEALKRFQYIDARKLSADQQAAEIKKVVEAVR
jgi:hypothetical protein